VAFLLKTTSKLSDVKNILDSLKINYNSTGPFEDLLREKFKYKTPTTDEIFLINNKYPAIIHATPKLFL